MTEVSERPAEQAAPAAAEPTGVVPIAAAEQTVEKTEAQKTEERINADFERQLERQRQQRLQKDRNFYK